MSLTGSRHRRGRYGLAGLTVVSAFCAAPFPEPPRDLVLWAWERPEDLRFLGAGPGVAGLVGLLELSGGRLWSRGRRPMLLTAPEARRTAVIRLQIDPGRPLDWSPELRRRTAETVLAYARFAAPDAIQIDFEAPRSQRQVLLDVLHDARAGLGERAFLSMTAPASWCDGERGLDAAPVDEIVPMLFRMGPGGAGLIRRLAAGGDFRNPRCRSALGMAVDQPLARLPAGRRIYLSNPSGWRPEHLESWRS